jgi:hypothetical protein
MTFNGFSNFFRFRSEQNWLLLTGEANFFSLAAPNSFRAKKAPVHACMQSCRIVNIYFKTLASSAYVGRRQFIYKVFTRKYVETKKNY